MSTSKELLSVLSEIATALETQLNHETKELEQLKSNTTAKRNVELLEELAKIFEAETKKRIALEVALKTIAEEQKKRRDEESRKVLPVKELTMESRVKLWQFVDEILMKSTKDKEKKVYRKTPYPSSSSSVFTNDSCGHVASACYPSFPCCSARCTEVPKHTSECATRCSCPTDADTSHTTSYSSVGISDYSLFNASLNKNLQSQSFLTSSSDKCCESLRTSVDDVPIQEATQMNQKACNGQCSRNIKTAITRTMATSMEQILDKKCKEIAEELHMALCSTAIQLHYCPKAGCSDDEGPVQQVSSEEVSKCMKYLISKGFPILKEPKERNCNGQCMCTPENNY